MFAAINPVVKVISDSFFCKIKVMGVAVYNSTLRHLCVASCSPAEVKTPSAAVGFAPTPTPPVATDALSASMSLFLVLLFGFACSFLYRFISHT